VAYNQRITLLNIIAKEISDEAESAKEGESLEAKDAEGHITRRSRGPRKSPDSVILGSKQSSKISLYELERKWLNNPLFAHFIIKLKMFIKKHFSVVNSVLLDEPETLMVSNQVIPPDLYLTWSRFMFTMQPLSLTGVWSMEVKNMMWLELMNCSMV
jgi:hypothetical protein